MIRKPFTGKWKVGQVVDFAYMTAAVSCQSAGLIKSYGEIVGTEQANHTTMYAMDDNTLLFEHEIKKLHDFPIDLSPTLDHEVVGHEFMGGADPKRWFCHSKDKQGYWMYPTDGSKKWVNVSWRAIGATFKKVNKDPDGRVWCVGFDIKPYTPWWKPYEGKRVGFTVKTRKNKYLLLIAKCIPDSDDCMLYVEFKSEPKFDSLDDALVALDKDGPKFGCHRIFRKPDTPGGMMGHWLVPLVIAEDGADPRKAVR